MLKTIILIIIVISIFYLLSIKYIHIYHSFWSKQPVSFFHSFKLKEGIISFNKSSNNILNNNFIIESILDNDIENIKDILNNNYSDHSICKYEYTNEYLEWFLHSDKKDRINLKISDGKNIIGCLTARPITIIIKDIKRSCLYADNLCIKKEYQRKGLVPILISHLIDEGFNNGYNLFIFQLENRKLPFRSIAQNINFIYRITNEKIDFNNFEVMDDNNIKKVYDFFLSYFKQKKNYIHYSFVEFYNFFINKWTKTYLEIENNNIINLIVVYHNHYTLENMKVIEIPYMLITNESSLFLKKIISIYFDQGFKLICSKNSNHKKYFKDYENYNKFISYIYMYNYHLHLPLYNHDLTFF